MFHKEGSVHGSKKAIMDVPVRKSERRKLLERARSYFADVLLETQGSTTTPTTSTSTSTTDSITRNNKTTETLDAVLDATFLQGALSARSLPIMDHHDGTRSKKAWTMVLYLKTPTTTETSTQAHATATTPTTPTMIPPSKSNTTSTPPMAAPPPDVWPYTSSSQFVWMALEEKNTVVQETPTVSLWAVLVNALPQLLTSYAIGVPAPVSKFVCRGADLMRAGISSLPVHENLKWTPNLMLPIVAEGNHQPFAVGHLLINPHDPIGPGSKGVGVKIWNAYGDDLWRFSKTKKNDHCQTTTVYWNAVGGAPFDNGHYGNLGFQQGTLVLSLDDDSLVDCRGEECDDDVSQDEASVDDAPSTIKEETDNTNVTTPDGEKPSPDDVLHHAVLRALLAMKNKDFPIPSGTFYAQHVIPSRLPGTTIDLKSTTYKKLGIYLKAQVERGLLQAGPDKNNPKHMDPMAIIEGYDQWHGDFHDVDKPRRQPQADNVHQRKIVLVSLFIIPSHWVSLLRLQKDDVAGASASSEERRGTGLLIPAEARKILDTYINQESLVSSERPQLVHVDGPLSKLLYSNEDIAPKLQVSRKELGNRFMANLLPGYALVHTPSNKILKLAKGIPPKVEIEVSKRRSKKFVTKVRGLEGYDIDPVHFAKDVSRRLACTGTIDTDPPSLRKNHVELAFQGNIALEIEAMLVNESLSNHGGIKGSTYSVPRQAVEVILRKGVPGRKGTKQ